MKHKGYALSISIFMSLFLLVICGIYLNTVSNQIRFEERKKDKLSAMYLAEAGVDHGIAYLTSTVKSNIKNQAKSNVTKEYLIDLPEIKDAAILDIGYYNVEFNPQKLSSKLQIGKNDEFEIMSTGISYSKTGKEQKVSYKVRTRIKIVVNGSVVDYSILGTETDVKD